MTTKEAIIDIDNFHPDNYDSLETGKYYETAVGDVYLESKPSIYQRCGERYWRFILVSDKDGHEYMDGEIVYIADSVTAFNSINN